jgi:ATP-binding cassette subfamily B protein
MAYFEDRSTGRLMAVLNDDINQLERFLDRGANEVLQVITTVMLIGEPFLCWPQNGLDGDVAHALHHCGGRSHFKSCSAPRYAEVRERVSLLNSRLANNLSGIMTIKSFTAEPTRSSGFAKKAKPTASATAVPLPSAPCSFR